MLLGKVHVNGLAVLFCLPGLLELECVDDCIDADNGDPPSAKSSCLNKEIDDVDRGILSSYKKSKVCKIDYNKKTW